LRSVWALTRKNEQRDPQGHVRSLPSLRSSRGLVTSFPAVAAFIRLAMMHIVWGIMTKTIYVAFRNKGPHAWAPADAVHVRDDLYQILDCRGDGGATQFREGALVKCRLQRLPAGDALVAYEAMS
jgi:hypothetical protein